tara:strand:- start:22 stop:1833 length:1812 start_codon:yes stop_codon:yes gene_type:complete
MSAKTPIRTVFNDSNVATGLAEFQTGEFVPLSHGGIGAALSIGSAGQVLKVNSGATALEFGAVEAIVNIDGATDLTGQTLVASDKLLASDGGTEGRINLSQIDTLFTGTTQTLTNKTISGSSNTLSNIGNSSLSNSTVNFGGVSLALGASDTTPAFDLSDATSYPTSSLTGTITNAQLAGSIANSKLSNSTVTIGTTSIALGASNTTIAGISNLTAGGINITGNSITSADSSIIEMGEGLSITGNLTVSGNMTVSGSTTTLETTNSTITDKLIELGNGTSGTPSGDAGIVIERGSSNNAFIGFDESADKFIVGTGTFTGSTTGDLTITTGTLVGNLEGNVTGNVTGNVSGSSGSTTGNAATATALATARNIGGVSFDGTGNINLPGVNTSGNQDTSGNAATATALETARNIAGQSFDGTGNITIASTDLSNTSAITLNTASQTLTNKTLTSPVLNTGVSGTAVKDEDNMASDSNTHLATQQSIKAYVDAQITAEDLDFQADSGGALSIDLDSETLTFTGGTGIDTSGSGNAVTFAIDSTVTTLSGTQTLTNKTLTSPKVNEDVAVTATATQLNHTVGVTSAIQTQLDAKTTPAFAIAQAVALG